MRTGTLVVLLCVVVIVALLQVTALLDFVVSPDPDVRAGPMYVTLTLTTGCALLMLLMALNASFLPLVPRRRAPDIYLVTAALGVTGVVTGLLTVGGAVNSIVTRLILGAMAFLFIVMQDTRLQRAREAARSGQAGAPAPSAQPRAPRAQPRSRRRQRRGGRKR
jgi:hypothetical protein